MTLSPRPIPRCLLTAACGLLLSVLAQAGNSIRVNLADGFQLPVGKTGTGEGYYVFRGFSPNAHMGEDWNGKGGGNTDLGDPVYATANGVVVYSSDFGRSWGNLVIIRHAYREGSAVKVVDSLYAHLDARSVRLYQLVKRGQQVGTIGTAHGLYAAHLHFEIRKNLQIGPQQRAFARDYSNYYSPRTFIAQHAEVKGGNSVVVPVDTFAGQGAETAAGSSRRPGIPTRETADAAAKAEEAARRKRKEELDKLVEENRRRAAAMKEEDMDGFWERVRKKMKKNR
jgi:murein DD-endopeptidase MepM/ murein hydrolase activator NlpD